MSTKIKKIQIVGIIISSIICIGFFFFVYSSCRNFLGDVYAGRDCTYCNIDNIEARAEINIPEINDSIECAYNAENDSKTAYFSVNATKINVEKYIEINKLKQIDNPDKIEMYHFFTLSKRPDTINNNFNNYYYKVKDGEREFSIVLFDKLTGNLWVYLKYKDAIVAKYAKPSHSYKSF